MERNEITFQQRLNSAYPKIISTYGTILADFHIDNNDLIYDDIYLNRILVNPDISQSRKTFSLFMTIFDIIDNNHYGKFKHRPIRKSTL